MNELTEDGTDAGACEPDGSDGDVGGGEPVSGGHAGATLGQLLSLPPSDDTPITSGTYAIYHATNGSIVLVLEDIETGVRRIALPRYIVNALQGDGRRKLINPLRLFGRDSG